MNSDCLAKPLCILYKQSLIAGLISKDWKCANITPVYKKGCKFKPSNYRPISLTSQVAKILESIVHDTMQDFLTKHNVINCHQHGFRKGKSCFTNLLETFEDLNRAVDEEKGIDVIYLDYKKALIPSHTRGYMQVAGNGITGNLLNWIRQLLCHRLQRVIVGGCTNHGVRIRVEFLKGPH